MVHHSFSSSFLSEWTSHHHLHPWYNLVFHFLVLTHRKDSIYTSNSLRTTPHAYVSCNLPTLKAKTQVVTWEIEGKEVSALHPERLPPTFWFHYLILLFLCPGVTFMSIWEESCDDIYFPLRVFFLSYEDLELTVKDLSDLNVPLNWSFLFSQGSQGHQREEYNVCSDDTSYQKPITIIHKSPRTFPPLLIGYHDNQSGSAPPDARHPVAQRRPAFHAWEYWESVWDAGEWWESSAALQTWMDVESILSAGGVHGNWPSICRQGNVSKHIVCGLIIAGLACWRSVWCNWVKMNGLPRLWQLQAQLTGAIRYTALTAVSASSLTQFFARFLFNHTTPTLKTPILHHRVKTALLSSCKIILLRTKIEKQAFLNYSLKSNLSERLKNNIKSVNNTKDTWVISRESRHICWQLLFKTRPEQK